MNKATLAPLLCALSALSPAAAAELDLYVDQTTKQLFAEPGPGRVKLGRFVQVDENAAAATATTTTTTPAAPVAPAAPAPAAPAPAATQVASAPVASNDDDEAWYERLNLRGYIQMRYNQELGGDADDLKAPGDRFIGRDQGMGIRRARLVLSGDINEHVSLYLQPDFASTPSGSSTGNFAQLRDAYADIYFDKKREYRVRVGQSKMPYGFENLQSSQNRLAPDRADALNSGLRDERDMGAVFYYAPKEVRTRFSDLTKLGLKGSGDYGMLGLGVYNGQGANRADRNDSLHVVAHATYPFKLDNGQYIEIGADAYAGRYVPSVEEVTLGGATFTPGLGADADRGVKDQRVGVHFVYYPQPFGVQAEWTWGEGPQLDVAQQRIRVASLNGGYVQTMYKMDGGFGSMMPYLKWQTYRGASKFDANAPAMRVDELEAGVEWQPMSALELLFAYSNMRRTDVSDAPYPVVEGDLLRFQLQVNY